MKFSRISTIIIPLVAGMMISTCWAQSETKTPEKPSNSSNGVGERASFIYIAFSTAPLRLCSNKHGLLLETKKSSDNYGCVFGGKVQKPVTVEEMLAESCPGAVLVSHRVLDGGGFNRGIAVEASFIIPSDGCPSSI